MKITGLKILKREIVRNKKGDILKYLTKDESFFKKFGEIYFSEVLKNKIKGWNFHKKNKCLLIVPYGKVRFHFIDGRFNSSSFFKEKMVIVSKTNYKLILVPPGVWFSFKSLSKLSLVANCLEKPHKEGETLKSNKIKNYIIPN